MITQKSGKVKKYAKRKGNVVKYFVVIVKTPKLKVIDYDDSYINFKLQGVGNGNSETIHHVKWYFIPVGSYNGNKGVLKDSDNCSQGFLTAPGVYKVKAKLNGKVYTLGKTVTLLSFKGDFNAKSFQDTQRVLPGYIVRSLRLHRYSFSIVGERSLDHFSQDLNTEHTVSGIHDLDNRRIVVSDTSANEFFAECFQQYYLAPRTLAKNCPKAYKFIKRTVQIDFHEIAGISW